MKIALTGSTGFVGVHLIHHLLREGHQVLAIKRPDSKLDEFELVRAFYALDPRHYERLEWVNAELSDPLALSDLFHSCRQVIHVAGFISYLRRDRAQLEEVNHRLTAEVVNACLDAGVAHLLFMGSIAANGKRSDGAPISEQDEWDPLQPHSYYGYTKQKAEMEVWRGQQEGLQISILRPGVILGYGDWKKSSLKLFRYASDAFAFYSNGITGFIGVNDLCKTVLHLVDKGGSNEAYLVVAENLTYRQVSDWMAEGLGTRPPRFAVKGPLYHLAYGLLWFREKLGWAGMLSLETARASISVNRFSNAKLRTEIPFELEPIRDVIATACAAYKKNSPPK